MNERAERTRRYGGSFRGLAFVVAWLCLAAQALGVAHLTVVRHATCLEHGEVVHSDAPADGVDGAAQSPHLQGTADTAARLQTAALPADGDSHDHCLVCATRREVVAPPAVQSLLAV